MSTSKQILKLRNRLELTQKQLALAFGLADSVAVYRWESGLRGPGETIRRLVLLINDLPKDEAVKFMAKLESYGKRKS